MPFCIFDAHCDTISRILDNDESIIKNDGHLDSLRIKKSNNKFIQVFAAFSEDKTQVFKIIDKYYSSINESEIIHCNSYCDIERNLENANILSVLSVEGGDVLEGNLETLRILYRLGVRLLTLTWNYSNEIADGILEKRGAGLSEFGVSVVKEMNRLGMIIDVSHLSEKGFWDVAEISNMPFVASHSNCKSLCSNIRNLTDEQIKEIIKQNGVIGINFYSKFLSENKSCIKDIIKHTEYILSLGGENSVGFGSDFDGIDSLPQGIVGVESFSDIIEEFLKLGYKEYVLKKILSDNFLRLFKTVLK